MAGVLEVVSGDTKPTPIQFQDSGTPKDITDWTVSARVGPPANQTLAGTIATPLNGEATIPFSSVAVGSYEVEIISINATGEKQTSEIFNLLVRLPL